MIWSSALGLVGLLSSASAYTALSDDSLRNLPDPGSDFDIKTGALLAPILQPRVPGTPGSTAVLTHFVDFFQHSLPEWKLSFQNSTSTTPLSNGAEIPFVNLIATRDPPWATDGEVGRLALVAHYDSKIDPPGFIGAIDSAAPCAMIMHIARSIDDALTKRWASLDDDPLATKDLEEDVGVQILLLDGEEAFHVWTHTDSVYGARSLAKEWEETVNPATSTYRTPLDSIDLFLLLDLLGSAHPTVPSYFKTTHWAYQRLAELEGRLRSLQQFKSSPNHPSKRSSPDHSPRDEPHFLPEANKGDGDRWMGGMIEDDHIPFQARGVDILHMIPAPFPSVWHNMDDDGEHLDLDTVEDWTKLFTAFTAEWMDLEGFVDQPKPDGGRRQTFANNERDEL
ncbi:hypothetical protein AAFC00_007181 [Neodothiora populina]|uniref:Peptide hydrolase n=1 Tax=Neodothiora populina TaxID=2781224 RepID=A0ABR3PHF7_9PEZI